MMDQLFFIFQCERENSVSVEKIVLFAAKSCESLLILAWYEFSD